MFEQFLNPTVNDRNDRYGSSNLDDRVRFVLEVVDATSARIGAGKVGIRLSPYGTVSDMAAYAETAETYLHLGRALSTRGLAYVHFMDQSVLGLPPIDPEFLSRFRATYTGNLMIAGQLDFEKAQQLVDSGAIDLPAFGQPFISNPDLVERFRHGWPLALPDRETYYGGGANGYVDYPVYQGI